MAAAAAVDVRWIYVWMLFVSWSITVFLGLVWTLTTYFLQQMQGESQWGTSSLMFSLKIHCQNGVGGEMTGHIMRAR